MNPPFSLKTSNEKEYDFIDCALRQMQDGGLLFSVLPFGALVRQGGYATWRKNLLRNNTLLSVVTFPEDLFYPAGTFTVGIFVKKGIRHPEDQNVLWVRALNDGLLKSKGKRLPNPRATNDYDKVTNTIRAFVQNPSMPVENINQFQKACPIDNQDTLLELVPENYLDQPPPDNVQIQGLVDQTVRDSVAFLIKIGEEGIWQ